MGFGAESRAISLPTSHINTSLVLRAVWSQHQLPSPTQAFSLADQSHGALLYKYFSHFLKDNWVKRGQLELSWQLWLPTPLNLTRSTQIENGLSFPLIALHVPALNSNWMNERMPWIRLQFSLQLSRDKHWLFIFSLLLPVEILPPPPRSKQSTNHND